MKTEQIRTDVLLTSNAVQQRASGLDEDTVTSYIDDAADGWPYPPIVIYRDQDGHHWVADGAHRLEAARRLSIDSIPADIYEGNERDATLYACGANANHGLPRTNADKRRAVRTLLTDQEWKQWSDRKIAGHCHVTHPTVAAVRRELEKFSSPADAAPPKRKTAAGHDMDPSGIKKANQNRTKSKSKSKNPTRTKTANEGRPKPSTHSEEVFQRLKDVCAELRKVEFPRQQWFEAAQALRDSTIWIFAKVPKKDAAAMRAKIADSGMEGPKDA